ncbi:RNA polymerase sigma factor [Maribacter sp. 2304DJ31-5]|uniref:RNA polymerase sigma factor n=1 Tax=Maribacter sp. 2304DJ31-5 TaxID=3386273 RepID=UPI0039BD38C0
MNDSRKIFDGLLVLQYRSGDEKALELLVKRYHKKLCGRSHWYVKDMDISQDIVQDCWRIIMHKINDLKDENAFESWAMRIVTRKSLNFLKREQRQREKLKSYGSMPREEEVYDEKTSEIQKLNSALKSLPHNQQEVLQLFYKEEYSLNEISEILQVSVGTIKSRLFHAREKLKTILKN